MNDCLLSIVTVTKNCVNTIDKTLSSVQAIKQGGIEYIVIDGVSTDGTLDVVRRYEAIVDCLVSEPDAGIYSAMNKGVALAHGEYVLFINGDDELVADDFSDVLSALRVGIADIICATTIVKLDNGLPNFVFSARPWKLVFSASSEGSPIPHPSSFVRIELLRKCPFREDFRIASDYDFFLRAYLSRRSFEVLPVATALFRLGGVSSDYRHAHKEVALSRREQLGWYSYVLNFTCGLLNLVSRVYRGSKRRFALHVAKWLA